ncbi:MAG: CDP-alcohol phosphatidyltransferase family protein [Solirubrobacterales bacterium]
MARERGFKRIAGIDRSGGPNERTSNNQPWRPWTIPNFIGYARALLIPIFFVIAWNSPDGRDTGANVALFICGASDYLDGLAARATGQFSRLGTLLDPLIDRVMILAAAIIIIKFELLPIYLMALLLIRETLMLVVSVPALLKGVEIKVNWIGRLAVWPLMAGGMLGLCLDTWVANVLVWIGVIGSYAASWLYFKAVWPQLRAKPQP